MKITLVLFHLVCGIVLFIAGLVVLKDNWQTPSFFLLSSGMIGMSIGVGLLLKQRWVQWLICVLMICATFSTIIILAGSVLLPESFAGFVILIYSVFMLVEVLSWIQVRRLTSGSPSKNTGFHTKRSTS
jgi:hypothetical protein